MQEKKDYNLELVQKRKEQIDRVSPTFCLAKWLQSTVLLYNGQTHSCHHPSRHQIKPEDIKNNAQGIHNTPVKMKAREDMLNGVQTSECEYCWRIENLNKDHISDRIYKSTYSWSFPRLEEVLKSGKGASIVPSYLEIAFDSTCNCKCLYCNPESSTSWEREIKEFGPIPQVDEKLYDLKYIKKTGALPIPHDQPNPYVEAFWDWWPEAYKNLKVFRVTGGEPLLSKNVWKLLDLIEENPRKELNFSINSNLCLPEATIVKFVEKIKNIQPKLASFEVYSSLESVGPQIEYVRSGMNYEQFIKNCRYILQNTPKEVRLHYMTTINLLSAPNFMQYLEVLKNLREEFRITEHNFRVRTFFNYLRWPTCLSLTLLDSKQKLKYSEEWVAYVEKYKITKMPQKNQYFYEEEVEQVKRLVDFMNSSSGAQKDYQNFRLFIREMDRRRATKFEKIFPTLTNYLKDDYFGE